jgi:Synergist-CTERM protein sorting domain-containing protein
MGFHDLHGKGLAVRCGTMRVQRRFGDLVGCATSNVHIWVMALGVIAPACTASEPELGVARSESTVDDYTNSTGCSTAVVIGLSKQIAQEAGCENPASFVTFEGAAGITLASNAVLPFLVKGARDDLETVAASNSLDVTSALRTLAQQYLLYAWYEQGRCGITAAATVGNSNHEGGRAVDLGNYSARISAMAAHGWEHDVPGDVVHFDHTSSPDDRGEDIKAFQVLWNANNAGDQIATDGEYGPQTEARLKASPATGFAIGPSCTDDRSLAADVVSVTGPDQVPPQTVAHYTIIVKNSGMVAWPATTDVELATGTSSPLYDSSWTSQTVVTALSAAVAVGDMTSIDMDVTTPNVDVSTPITQVLALDDGGTKFGTINLVLTVAPGADTGSSGDGEPGGDTGSDSGMDQGHAGCNAGGEVGWLALVLPALVLRRRRRN